MLPIPNQEQLKSIVRWVISLVGGFIAGWAAKSGLITTDQVWAILNSETFIGLAVSAVGLIWSMIARTKVGLITAATTVPEVQKIELVPLSGNKPSIEEANRLAKATPPVVQLKTRV